MDGGSAGFQQTYVWSNAGALFGSRRTSDLPRCDITNITKTVRHGAAPYASISVVGAHLMVFFFAGVWQTALPANPEGPT